VVDYLQFMHGSSKRAGESRALEVSEISKALKTTAKELNIPIIALAQLNRDASKITEFTAQRSQRTIGQKIRDIHRRTRCAGVRCGRSTCATQHMRGTLTRQVLVPGGLRKCRRLTAAQCVLVPV
jgi:hypothetical protein